MYQYENCLAHHGVLGMKWGKRNGPPYPLGASDHSASEKKAGWRKSLGNAIRSLNQTRCGCLPVMKIWEESKG